MRLWHYKLIPYLPKSQLLAQWRELNSIFRKEDKHILINYIYEYGRGRLLSYTISVMEEMKARGIKIRSTSAITNYFKDAKEYLKTYPEHNNRYLLQCFYNLQEKYDRGQKDFTRDIYKKLENFVKGEIEHEKL